MSSDHLSQASLSQRARVYDDHIKREQLSNESVDVARMQSVIDALRKKPKDDRLTEEKF